MKIFGKEVRPKIFQSFNSLLGSVVRRSNSSIVGPSRQLVGEFPALTFERLYEYYHGWDMVKRGIDTIHQKLTGAGIEITSDNELFNVFIEKWMKVVNLEEKVDEWIYSILITGNGMLEKQYTDDKKIGNVEHIPMKTFYRIFRDQFAQPLKYVQILDGVFKELDPQYLIHQSINNPDREGWGKSEFHSIAVPRPIAVEIDALTGQDINPEKTMRPLLDSQAILQNSEIEIKDKMGKPRIIVGAPGMNRDQMDRIEQEMSDERSKKYIWLFDKQITSQELQISPNTKFENYGNNVDEHIDLALGFASNVIKNPGSFSYSSSQTPFDVLDERMNDLKRKFCTTLYNKLVIPVAKSWGFKNTDKMNIKVTFMPSVKKLTFEDINNLDPAAVSAEEKRDLYKKMNIQLDDSKWQPQEQGMPGMMPPGMPPQEGMPPGPPQEGQPPPPPLNSEPPQIGKPENPFQKNQIGKPEQIGQKSQTGQNPFQSQNSLSPQSPQVDFPTPPTPDNVIKRPKPPRTDQRESYAPTRNDYMSAIKSAAKEHFAQERIPLPPKAGYADNSNDLYVNQGLDQKGLPTITDPDLREKFDKLEKKIQMIDQKISTQPQMEQNPQLGQNPLVNKNPEIYSQAGKPIRVEEEEPEIDPQTGRPIDPRMNDDDLPASAPQRDAHFPDQPDLGDDNYNRFGEEPNEHGENPDEIPGDHTMGGTGDDRINRQSTGDYKDPYDLDGTDIPEPELGQQTQTTHAGPYQVSGGTRQNNPLLNNTVPQKDGQTNDMPSELDPRDNIDPLSIPPKDTVPNDQSQPNPSLARKERRIPFVRNQDTPQTFTEPATDGDDTQQRSLRDGKKMPPLEPNDSNNILDNTGLNMKPDKGELILPSDVRQRDGKVRESRKVKSPAKKTRKVVESKKKRTVKKTRKVVAKKVKKGGKNGT